MSDWGKLTLDIAMKVKCDIVNVLNRNIDLLMSAAKEVDAENKLWSAKTVEAGAASVTLLALQDAMNLNKALIEGNKNIKRKDTAEGIAAAAAFTLSWIAFEKNPIGSLSPDDLGSLEVKLRDLLTPILIESGMFKEENINRGKPDK